MFDFNPFFNVLKYLDVTLDFLNQDELMSATRQMDNF